jgi:hypothetical protein
VPPKLEQHFASINPSFLWIEAIIDGRPHHAESSVCGAGEGRAGLDEASTKTSTLSCIIPGLPNLASLVGESYVVDHVDDCSDDVIKVSITHPMLQLEIIPMWLQSDMFESIVRLPAAENT